MENIVDLIRIRFNELTSGQKAVAKFVLEKPEQMALYPAKEIGVLTQTSETTVIRFCLALGFSGFSILQDEIRKSLLTPKTADNTLRKFSESAEYLREDNQLPTSIMEQDFAFIEKTIAGLEAKVLAKAVDSIIAAKKIVVVGLRASHAPAYWLAYTLNMMRGETILYRGGIDDANYLFTEMNKNWLVIALSFPRYSAETVKFVQAAKDRSAKILAITDDELSPLGLRADVFMKTTTPQPATLKGMAVIFSLLNVLIGGVMAKDRNKVQKRINNYDQTNEQFFSFVKDDRVK